eukprot:scaffold9009_cov130-Isochrysis_galbana.AAC.9
MVVAVGPLSPKPRPTACSIRNYAMRSTQYTIHDTHLRQCAMRPNSILGRTHLLPPARPAARWGWGPGCRLYLPPAARPAAPKPRNSPFPPPAAPPRPRRASAAR